MRMRVPFVLVRVLEVVVELHQPDFIRSWHCL